MTDKPESDKAPRQSLLLQLGGDDLWLDVFSPIQVVEEKSEPFRVAIKATIRGLGSVEATHTIWVRFERPQTFDLKQKLSTALERLQGKAPEITQTLRFERVLGGGVDPAGRMLLKFQGQSGLAHVISLPRDQSGPLGDCLNDAASKAAGLADKAISDAASGIAKVELTPYEADLVQLVSDPLTGKEFLNVRLHGGREYSFALTLQQAQALRQSQPPQAKIPGPSDNRPN